MNLSQLKKEKPERIFEGVGGLEKAKEILEYNVILPQM